MTATFPESRWRRAGAKAREILDLSAEWNQLADAAREEYAKDVAAVADSELARRLAVRRGVEPAPETPAAPPADTPLAPSPSTVGPDPAGQPGADPDTTTLPEQTAEATGEPMTPVDGDTVTGDGTGQALPPVPEQPDTTPLDESGLVDGEVPQTPAPADDPTQTPEAAETPPAPVEGAPADAGPEPTDEELAPYLATKDSVVAYLAEHPELRERLLVLESEGKARRSVLDVLSLSE